MTNAYKNEPYNNTAAFYLRYSSDNQTVATISAQDRICTAFAEAEGYTVYKKYTDEAESATTTDNRTAFLEMISDAKAGKFKYIIVWQFSRFARNKEESVIFKALLRKSGVRVISATEKTDDTPSGKLLEGMLEVLNQYFSDNLSVEVKKGKKENVLTGKHAGGKLPYGIYKEADTDLFKIDENKGKIIKRIFELYLEGYGGRRIADKLVAAGYPAPEGKNWNKSSIGQILDNEAYIGIYNYTISRGTEHEETFKLDNVYPQLIDDRTWAISRRIKLEKKPKRAARNRLYLLTGKSVCGGCGRSYVGNSLSNTRKGVKVKHYYYRCNGKCHISKGAKSCRNKDVNAEKIETWVLEKIAEHILDDKAIDNILVVLAKKIKGRASTQKGDIKKLQKEEKEINAKIDRFLDLYGDGEISKARLNEKTEGLEKILNTIRIELNQLQNLATTDIDLDEVRAYLVSQKANISEIDENTKKALIDAFVHKITIGSDDVKLTLKIDENLGKELNFSAAVVDMSITAVANKPIYTTEVTASFDEATKKRYTPYDPEYSKYDAKRREYRQSKKAK